MKPVIKVWCLPKMEEDQLRQLHKKIVAAIVDAEIGWGHLKSENDMICLFPPDMMAYGVGKEIVVEITSTDSPVNSFPETFAKVVGTAIHEAFPGTYVQCYADRLTTWSSS